MPIRLNSPWPMIVGSLFVLGILVGLLVWKPGPSPDSSGKQSMLVYCGAGVRAPVDAAAKEYEREYGVSVNFQYGPSQTLVAQAEVSRTGDLILPGDDSFLDLARKKGLIDEAVPLARMVPILAVAKGNPKQIKSLDDALKPDVRLGQAAPESTATGRLVREALEKSGDWERVKSHTAVFKGTVNDVANDITVGSVDAGFVWDVLLTQYPKLEAVSIPQLARTQALVSVGLLKSSPDPTAARRFMRYLAAKNKGLKLFKDHGFEPVEGETWRETP